METILVFGAGMIGRFVGVLLAASGSYQVRLVDIQSPDTACQALLAQYPNLHFDTITPNDVVAISTLCEPDHVAALISCLPFHQNPQLAKHAKQHGLHYFDLSEDRETQAEISAIAKDASTVFVPQCGVAPGLVDIVAHDMLQQFESLHSAQLCVGALPQQVSNEIHYELSWSVEGLINEYLNPCEVIDGGKRVEVPAMSGLARLDVQGESYEIFHTSGGLSTLAEYYEGKIDALHYKTIRYVGHAEAMHKLFKQYNHDRDKLREWYIANIPFTDQDMVVMYINVVGKIDGQLKENSFFRKWLPIPLDGNTWTAIQWLTASEVCAMCDSVLQSQNPPSGLHSVQDIQFHTLKNNRFLRPLQL